MLDLIVVSAVIYTKCITRKFLVLVNTVKHFVYNAIIVSAVIRRCFLPNLFEIIFYNLWLKLVCKATVRFVLEVFLVDVLES